MKITHNLEFSYFSEPKIIAEISGNHKGNKREFLKLIKSACLNGADLIKIQTYEPLLIKAHGKEKDYGIYTRKHVLRFRGTKMLLKLLKNIKKQYLVAHSALGRLIC